MSGVAVIINLLLADAATLAATGADQIMAGDIPLGTTLPVLGVSLISGTPRNTLSMLEPGRLMTDRVQVTALVKLRGEDPEGTGYPGMKALLALVLAACPNQRGTVGGILVDSILPDIEGPDFNYTAEGIVGGSRDFIVKWKTA